MFARVHTLEPIRFQIHEESRGKLVAIDIAKVAPFPITRVFWIYGVPSGLVRGGHAHKVCHQFLVCLVGRVSIELFDGENCRNVILETGCGLHIPPAIFATERYETADAVLTVYCSHSYDPIDYIHEPTILEEFRQGRFASVQFTGTNL